MSETLKDTISTEIETRWREFLSSHDVEYDWFLDPSSAPTFSIGESGSCSVVDFQGGSPFVIVDSIAELVSNQAEAKVVIDDFFTKVSADDENIPDGYHSHSQDVGTVTHVYTSSALSSVDTPEKIYALLCNSPYANIPTEGITERVVSKVYGGEAGSKARDALVSVPTEMKVSSDDVGLTGWREALQRNVLSIIKDSGIGEFETICRKTAYLLNQGKYEDDVLSEAAMHHHGTVVSEGKVTCYKTDALKKATGYLAEKGIPVNVPAFCR